jgi:hypothetical protein
MVSTALVSKAAKWVFEFILPVFLSADRQCESPCKQVCTAHLIVAAKISMSMLEKVIYFAGWRDIVSLENLLF